MFFANELIYGIVEQYELIEDDECIPMVKIKLAFNLGNKKRLIQDLLMGGYYDREFYIKDNVLHLEAEYEVQQWMLLTGKVIFTDKKTISCLITINFSDAGKMLGYSIRSIE